MNQIVQQYNLSLEPGKLSKGFDILDSALHYKLCYSMVSMY